MCALRSPDHVQLVIVHGEPLFFSQRDSPWLPTLRLLHRYPAMMARVQADTGAVKFVLQGANIMCPGLTSPGADLPVEVLRPPPPPRPPLPPPPPALPSPGATRKNHAARLHKVAAATAAGLWPPWCLLPFYLQCLVHKGRGAAIAFAAPAQFCSCGTRCAFDQVLNFR